MATVKKGDTLVLVGTRKGLFLFHSRDRKRWSSRGPYFEGDTIRHAILDPDDGKTVFAGVTSEHWGPVVARSTDFGAKWTIPKEGPRFSKESGISVTKLRHLGGGHLRDEGRRRILVHVRFRDPLVREAEGLRPRGPQHVRPQDGPGPAGPGHRVPAESRWHVPAHEGRPRVEDHRDWLAHFQEHGGRVRVPDRGPSARSRDCVCRAPGGRLQPRDTGRRDGGDPYDGWRGALDQDDEGAAAEGCVVHRLARRTSHGCERSRGGVRGHDDRP